MSSEPKRLSKAFKVHSYDIFDKEIKKTFIFEYVVFMDGKSNALSQKVSVEDIKKMKKEKNTILSDVDTIKNLKEKIQFKTSIPTHFQHLFIKRKKNSSEQIGYVVTLNDNIQKIDLLDLYKDTKEKDLSKSNIMIMNEYFFINNNLMKIVPLDLSFSVSELHTDEIFVVNLNDILSPNMELLETISKKTELMEKLYFSFIVLFWPMILYDDFVKIVKGRFSHKTYYNEGNIEMEGRVLKALRLNIHDIKDSIFIKKYMFRNFFLEDVDISKLFFNFLPTEEIPNCILNKDNAILCKSIKTQPIRDIKIHKVVEDAVEFNFSDLKLSKANFKCYKDQYVFDFIWKIQDSRYQENISEKIEIIKAHTKLHIDTSFYSKINSSFIVFYDIEYSQAIYESLKRIIMFMENINFVQIKSETKNNIKLYVTKGFNNIYMSFFHRIFSENSNYYEIFQNYMLYKRFMRNFESKIIDITVSFSRIKCLVSFNDPKNINFLAAVVNIMMNSLTSEKKRSTKFLKEVDPVLYNIGKKKHYSRICLKKFQPSIVPKGTPGAIQYKNITTGRDLYYKCADPKYKYLKFIVNKHPDDYCLPCCYKVAPKNDPIYDECMKHFKFSGKKKKSYSIFVPAFSMKKQIFERSLIQIPEFLKIILDPKQFYVLCFHDLTIKKLMKMLFFSEDKSDEEFYRFVSNTVQTSKQKRFRFLVHDQLEELPSVDENSRWWIMLCEFFFQIKLIFFEVTSEEKLNLVFDKNSSNDIQSFDKFLVVFITENNLSEPSYSVLIQTNPKKFMTQFDKNSCFISPDNQLIERIKILVEGDKISRGILFSKIQSQFRVLKVFVNKNQHIYAVEFEYSKSRKPIYLNVEETMLSKTDNSVISKIPLQSEAHLPAIEELADIMKIIHVKKNDITRYIMFSGMCIGLLVHGIFALCKRVNENEITDLKSVLNITRLNIAYHPIEINKKIYNYLESGSEISIFNKKKIGKRLFTLNFYDILVSQIAFFFSAYKNNEKRKRLAYMIKENEEEIKIQETFPEDFEKILYCMKNDINIDTVKFKFDFDIIDKISEMPLDSLIRKIETIVGRITVSRPTSQFDIEKYYDICTKGSRLCYCEQNKLVVPSSVDLRGIIKIIASDLKNKWKRVFYKNPFVSKKIIYSNIISDQFNFFFLFY